MSNLRNESEAIVKALSPTAHAILLAIIEFEKQHISEPEGFAAVNKIKRIVNSGVSGEPQNVRKTPVVSRVASAVRFTAVEITDCGPFAGVNRIDFSKPNSVRPVTLILGENGSGKSAFSGLLQWCLFGVPPKKVSPLIYQPKAGGKVAREGIVTVEMVGPDGHHYRVSRLQRQPGVSGSKQEFTVGQRAGEGGTWENRPEAEAIVNTLLPKALRPYIFLTGEGLSHSQDEEAQEDLVSAIRYVLGFEVLARAQKHIEEVIPKMLGASKRLDIGEPSKIEVELETLHKEHSETRGGREKQQKKLKTYRKLISQLNEALVRLKVAASRAESRKRWEKSEKDAEDNYEKALLKKRETIGKYSYLALLSGEPHEKLLALTEKLQREKRLPPPVSRALLDELLKQSTCLCGRSLNPSDAPAAVEQVRRLADSGGEAGVDAGFQCLNAFFREISSHCEGTLGPNGLGSQNDQLRNALAQKKIAIHELAEIAKALSGDPEAEVRALESKRQQYDKEREDLQESLAASQNKIIRTEELIKKKKEDLGKVETGSAAAQKARKAYAVTEELNGVLKKLADIKESTARDMINKDLASRCFGPKFLVGQVSEDFRLQTFESDGAGKVSRVRDTPSTGEILCTALGLVRALSEIQNSPRTGHNELDLEVRGFPTVIDAPTSPLGTKLIADVCGWLVHVIRQPILLMNDEHWAGSREHLGDAIGMSAVCELHVPGTERTIKLADGTEAPFIVSDPKNVFSIIRNYEE